MTVRTAARFRSDGEASRMYWGDMHDVYRQPYATGSQIVHLSEQPISVPKVILNFETVGAPEGQGLSCTGCPVWRKCILDGRCGSQGAV